MSTPGLPGKLSELLDLSVTDCEAVEKLPNYELDMGTWHQILYTGDEAMCCVCMAGAVMDQTLGEKTYTRATLEPEHFSYEVSNKLHAINCMRTGRFEDAAYLVHRSIKLPPELVTELKQYVPERHGRVHWPWGFYREAARLLREAGY